MGPRAEIIESRKARADLFKWKIILVAAISAAARGVSATGSATANKPEYLLCLLPLVCVYTDLLCPHMNLRIRVIGQFLRVSSNRAGRADEAFDVRYEEFVHKARGMPKSLSIGPVLERVVAALRSPTLDAYVFEDYALHVSTMLLSMFVLFWGVVNQLGFFPNSLKGEPAIFYLAGGLGVAASGWALFAYHRRLAALEELAERELAEQRRTPQSLVAGP